MTLGSQQYANLADFSYGRDQKGNENIDLGALVGKQVTMVDGVTYKIMAHADKPSGYQGTIFQRVDTGEIVVAHRGTEFGREPIKDGLLTDGGMVFGRVNQQADDAVALTKHAMELAKQYGDRRSIAPPEVSVTGHSLGGTLAQVTAHHFDLRGETFNPYGAASLNLRIPESSTSKVINNVMAADVVSAASPHYGQVRIFARAGEITQLNAAGYWNNRVGDALTPDHPIMASANTSHMMHNFLNVDGKYRPDLSVLEDPAARKRAGDNSHAIENYRGDVRSIRAAASLGGDVYDVLKGGVWNAPERAYERIKESREPPLAPGEPARQERTTQSHSSAPQTQWRAGFDSVPGLKAARAVDMRDAEHPANPSFRQAYAGVVEIDKSRGRAPDWMSERLAASLTAASAGAGMSSIGRVGLSQDGSKAFVVEASNAPLEARNRVHVDVNQAVQRTVENSTVDWQASTNQLLPSNSQQQVQERDNLMARGPALS